MAEAPEAVIPASQDSTAANLEQVDHHEAPIAGSSEGTYSSTQASQYIRVPRIVPDYVYEALHPTHAALVDMAGELAELQRSHSIASLASDPGRTDAYVYSPPPRPASAPSRGTRSIPAPTPSWRHDGPSNDPRQVELVGLLLTAERNEMTKRTIISRARSQREQMLRRMHHEANLERVLVARAKARVQQHRQVVKGDAEERERELVDDHRRLAATTRGSQFVAVKEHTSPIRVARAPPPLVTSSSHSVMVSQSISILGNTSEPTQSVSLLPPPSEPTQSVSLLPPPTYDEPPPPPDLEYMLQLLPAEYSLDPPEHVQTRIARASKEELEQHAPPPPKPRPYQAHTMASMAPPSPRRQRQAVRGVDRRVLGAYNGARPAPAVQHPRATVSSGAKSSSSAHVYIRAPHNNNVRSAPQLVPSSHPNQRTVLTGGATATAHGGSTPAFRVSPAAPRPAKLSSSASACTLVAPTAGHMSSGASLIKMVRSRHSPPARPSSAPAQPRARGPMRRSASAAGGMEASRAVKTTSRANSGLEALLDARARFNVGI